MVFKLSDIFRIKKKTFTARIVEVKPETHTCYAAFWNLYGKFYCVVPTGYLSPNGSQITAHYYDSTEELNKDLRGYISMFFNKIS